MRGIKFKVIYKPKKPIEPLEKLILFKGYFHLYEKYDMLVKKAVERSKLGLFQDYKLNFTEKSKYLFSLKEKTNKIPEGCTTEFWNDESYQYVKERLMPENKSEERPTYIITIEKIKEEKIWNPKPYEQTFKLASECCSRDMQNNIKYQLEKGLFIQDFKEEFHNSINNKKKSSDKKNEENHGVIEDNETKNLGIICQNCFKFDFPGTRYICSECPEYNLCKNCKSLLNKEHFHNEDHVFIQVHFPHKIKDNNLYCIVDKKVHYLSINEKQNPQEIKFNIINSSTDVDFLENCFIQPIRYGENYLKCIREKIEKFERKAEKKEITLKILLPKEKNDNKYYEGYFRMFSKEGYPFGDVIQVIMS